jgi:hypothetical protein
MVKLGRERIIPSISRLCQPRMLGPIGISSSLRSGPTRMNPLHHRIREGISPIHHDDNLLLDPRGRLSLHSQRRVQPGMEFGKRMSMMSRIYLLIERVQDLPFLCVRPRPIRLRHRGDLHLLPLRSLGPRFLDYLHLELLPPIPPLPMVLDLLYPEHHTRRIIRRFTVSARLSPIDQTPHPTATKHPTSPVHFDHSVTSLRSPNRLTSTTHSSSIFRLLVLSPIIEGRTHSPTLHQPCIITTRILHTLHIASRHYSNLLSAFSSAAVTVKGTVTGLQYTCQSSLASSTAHMPPGRPLFLFDFTSLFYYHEPSSGPHDPVVSCIHLYDKYSVYISSIVQSLPPCLLFVHTLMFL